MSAAPTVSAPTPDPLACLPLPVRQQLARCPEGSFKYRANLVRGPLRVFPPVPFRAGASSNACLLQAQKTDNMLQAKHTSYEQRQEAIDKLWQARRDFIASSNDLKERQRCSRATAKVIHGHAHYLLSIISNRALGMKKGFIAMIKAMYLGLIREFSNAELVSFELTYDTSHAQAWEALCGLRSNLGDGPGCLEACEKSIASDPHGPIAGPAALGSAICSLPDAMAHDVPPLPESVRELTSQEQVRLRALQRLLCHNSSNRDYDRFRFTRAQILYEAGRWLEAAIRLFEIASTEANQDAGLVAARWYVAATHRLSTEPAAAGDCGPLFKRNAAQLHKLYCGEDQDDQPKLCAALETAR